MAWEIKYYQNARGDYPVYMFLQQLDSKTNKKVKAGIAMLEQYGPFLKSPYMKKLAPNLYELRIKTQIAIRVFYSHKIQVYYLLHAFKKQSQKTPKKELQIALDRLSDLI